MTALLLSLHLSVIQAHWLNVAYDEGNKYGLPKYTQAIILVESSACLHRRGDDGRSLGCGQLQVATARKVCHCKIEQRTLLQENQRNISISAEFLSECFASFWPDRNRAIFCFNRGIPAASKAMDSQVTHSRYVARVLKALGELQKVRVSYE